MPISVKCQCGKALNIPDTMAGKAVKCPGCASVIRVPSAGSGTAATASATNRPATQAAMASRRMDDLFDEEGFSAQVAQVCPACRAEMQAGSVLCTKCGYHKESGVRFESHKTAGVDISHGTLALQKAKADIEKAARLDKAVLDGAGMPWWMLALVLFMIVSGLSIAVLVVNASRRVDESITFNPMATFLMLSGVAFFLVAQGAFLMIVIHAFKQKPSRGALTMFVPFYAIYHVFKNARETWKFLIVTIITGGIGAALLVAASNA